MKIVVTNPAFSKPLEFEMSPTSTTGALFELINTETSLQDGKYDVFYNNRAVDHSDTLLSLLSDDGGTGSMTFSLVVRMQSGFFVVP